MSVCMSEVKYILETLEQLKLECQTNLENVTAVFEGQKKRTFRPL